MTINDVIILPVNQQIIDKTMKNVVKKLNHTNISLMYNRTPVELLDNLYMGDLAKNALYDYLINRVSVPAIQATAEQLLKTLNDYGIIRK